jgi:hypothetical protein
MCMNFKGNGWCIVPRKYQCVDCGGKCYSLAEVKRCRICYEVSDQFGKPTKIEYRRQWALQKKYKLDLVDFETLWIVFKGRCGICDKTLILPLQQRGQPPNSACVDHDHNTGNLRGLLCNACNKGIGLLKDDLNTVYSAYKWLGGKYD